MTSARGKWAEQQVADALDFNQRLVAASPLGIATYDASGQCVSANAAAARIVGATLEQYLRQNFRHIESWRQSGLLDVAEAALAGDTQQPRELYITTTFGDQVWLDCRLVRFDAGGAPHLLLLFGDITKRKQTEMALSASEARYRALFEGMDSGFALHEILVDEAGRPYDYRFLEVNPAFVKQIGLEAGEIVGKSARAVFPNLEPEWIQSYGEVALSGQALQFERYTQALDRTFHVVAYCPQPGQFAALFTDITQIKEAERALRASEDRYRRVVDTIHDLIYEGDYPQPGDVLNGRLTFVGQQAESILGYRPEEFLQNPGLWLSSVHPDDVALVSANSRQAVAQGKAHTRVYRLRNRVADDYRWIEDTFIPKLDAASQVIGFLGIARDISERKAAERKLAELEDLYRRAIAAAGAVPYRQDARDGRYTFIGEGIEQLCGYSAQEMTQEIWDELKQEDVLRGPLAGLAWQEALRRVREGEVDFWTDDCRILNRQGEERWVADTSAELRDEQGKSIGSIGLLQDITERKQMEDALRRHATRMQILAEAARVFAEQTLDYPGVLDTMARHIAGWLGGSCMIRLFAADGQSLGPATIYDDDPAAVASFHALIDGLSSRVDAEPFTQRILETKRTVLIPALDRTQMQALFKPVFWPILERAGAGSLIVAPMRIRGQIMGLLYVLRRQAAAPGRPAARAAGQVPFDEDDQGLVQDLADRAALTITNARLYVEAQSRLEQLQALHAIDSAILATEELSAILDVVVEQVAAQLGIDAVDILQFDPATRELVYAAGIGFRGDAIRRSRLHLGEGTAGQAAQQRHVVYQLNWAGDESFARSDLLAGEDFVGYYSVPLVAHGDIQGVLDLFHRAPLAPTSEWLAFLEAVAMQVAVAIEHARLFVEIHTLLQQTQAQARQLEQILNTVPEGVVLLDHAQRVVTANPVAQAYLAAPRAACRRVKPARATFDPPGRSGSGFHVSAGGYGDHVAGNRRRRAAPDLPGRG